MEVGETVAQGRIKLYGLTNQNKDITISYIDFIGVIVCKRQAGTKGRYE